MPEYNYPTAYVAGATKIPIRTIQDYVQAYRKHFSNQAGQAKKGRRFLPSDVNKLLIIKRLRNERFPDDEIEKYLSGELELPFKLAHEFSDEQAMDMVKNSLEIFSRVTDMLEKSDEQINDMRRLYKLATDQLEQTRRENQALKNQFNNIQDTLRKFREWQIFMMKIEPDFNMYKQDDQGEPMPEIKQEKKSLFSKLLHGGDWSEHIDNCLYVYFVNI